MAVFEGSFKSLKCCTPRSVVFDIDELVCLQKGINRVNHGADITYTAFAKP